MLHAAFGLIALLTSTNPCDKIPLFAKFLNDGGRLHSYRVPVRTTVAIHKLFTFHIRLNGTVRYKGPDDVALDMRRVPAPDRRLFAHLGAPRTWMHDYDLRLVGTDKAGGHTIYHIIGTPREDTGVAHMAADIDDTGEHIAAEWSLKGGGTIKSTIESQTIDGYLLPKREVADIAVPGHRLHADMAYGNYRLNAAALTSSHRNTRA